MTAAITSAVWLVAGFLFFSWYTHVFEQVTALECRVQTSIAVDEAVKLAAQVDPTDEQCLAFWFGEKSLDAKGALRKRVCGR